jgi:hypothetical protein
MGRFADIAKGTRALHTVTLPLVEGVTVEVAVRPLNGAETGSAQAQARAYALAEMTKVRGDSARPLPEPKEGDRLFDLGYAVATLALACVDPKDTKTPFFAGTEEILAELDPDRIVLLYEEQQAWQDRCAPPARKLGPMGLMGLVAQLAAEEEDAAESPFLRLRPSIRLRCIRTICKLFMSFPQLKSPSGSTDGSADSP